jgi:hypothetical protein
MACLTKLNKAIEIYHEIKLKFGGELEFLVTISVQNPIDVNDN